MSNVWHRQNNKISSFYKRKCKLGYTLILTMTKTFLSKIYCRIYDLIFFMLSSANPEVI